jgi:hypothetical protein
VLLRLAEKVAKVNLPDVARTMSYRSGFFGGPYAALLQSVMRGPSQWTGGQRELFGRLHLLPEPVPVLNGAHGAAASTVLGEEITKAVFADPGTAPISGRLKTALGLVRKLTLSPQEAGTGDLGAILSAGVSEDAVRDAVYVCFAFNLTDPVSDALGFDVMDEKGYRRGHRSCSGSGTSSRHRSGCWPGTRPGRLPTADTAASPNLEVPTRSRSSASAAPP